MELTTIAQPRSHMPGMALKTIIKKNTMKTLITLPTPMSVAVGLNPTEGMDVYRL
jgi:hypothetical protein